MTNLNSNAMGKLLSTERASDYLGLKLYTFRNALYNDKIKTPAPTRIGGRVFFTQESLDKFVQENTEAK